MAYLWVGTVEFLVGKHVAMVATSILRPGPSLDREIILSESFLTFPNV